MGLLPAALTPCDSCPWLTENHGKPHEHGWYTTANMKRLWKGLRNGDPMSCHSTDPDNVVPEGYRPVPEGTKPRECTGGLILQQREVSRFQTLLLGMPEDESKGAMPCYRKAHPQGMTRAGLTVVTQRAVFGGTLLGGSKMTTPDLNLPVSYPALKPWDPSNPG